MRRAVSQPRAAKWGGRGDWCPVLGGCLRPAICWAYSAASQVPHGLGAGS